MKQNHQRYIRQLALPQIDDAAQKKLAHSRILMVGAGVGIRACMHSPEAAHPAAPVHHAAHPAAPARPKTVTNDTASVVARRRVK